MQKLGGFSKSPPFLLFSFALSSALLPHLLHSFLGFILSSPIPRLRCPHFAHARAHSRTSADFRFLPSPFTALSQLTVYQHTRGEHLPHTIPFTFPSPPLSRFSPTGYGKVPLFQHFPRISLATLPASPTAKSGTEQVKAFSSKPSPLTL